MGVHRVWITVWIRFGGLGVRLVGWLGVSSGVVFGDRIGDGSLIVSCPVVGVGFDGVALSADDSEVVVYDQVVGWVGVHDWAVWDVESEADVSVECDVLCSELL